MNLAISKLECCRELVAGLQWNERLVEKNVRIAVSKAIWLGVDVRDLMQLVCTIPNASYLHHHLNILLTAWTTITRADPNQYLTEFDQLMNVGN